MPGFLYREKPGLLLGSFVNLDSHSEWHNSVALAMCYRDRNVELRDNAFGIEVNS